MLGPLVVLALLTTINPVRLGIILLVLSRPRPMQNLFAYWIGALTTGITTLLVPLIALHITPLSASFAESFAHPSANPAAQRTAIGIGVILLVVAALTAARSLAGNSAAQPTLDRSGAAGSSAAQPAGGRPGPEAPQVITRLLNPVGDVGTVGRSPIRRLLRSARTAWQNGSPWISFTIGIVVLPPLDGVVLALAIIVSSGAALGTQVAVAIAYIIGVLIIEEIILVANTVAPAKVQAALRRLHDWARAHHRKFVAAILAVAGLSLLLRGLGGI